MAALVRRACRKLEVEEDWERGTKGRGEGAKGKKGVACPRPRRGNIRDESNSGRAKTAPICNFRIRLPNGCSVSGRRKWRIYKVEMLMKLFPARVAKNSPSFLLESATIWFPRPLLFYSADIVIIHTIFKEIITHITQRNVRTKGNFSYVTTTRDKSQSIAIKQHILQTFHRFLKKNNLIFE